MQRVFRQFYPSHIIKVSNLFYSFLSILLFYSLLILNFEHSLLQKIFFIGIVFVAIFLKREILLINIVFLLPFADIIKVANDSYTVIPFLIIIYILKCSRDITLDKYFVITYLTLLLLTIMNSLLYSSGNIYYVPFFAFLLFAYYLAHDSRITNYFSSIAKTYLLSTQILVLLYIIFSLYNGIKLSDIIFSNARLSGFSSPWGFGLTLLIGASFLIVLSNLGIIRNKIFVIINFIIFLFFGLKTGTFSILLGFLVLFTSFVFNIEHKRFSGSISKTIIIILIAIFSFAILTYVIDLRNGISDNGRFEIWMYYLNYIFLNIHVLLFGYGAGSITLFAISNNILTAHNVVLEFLFQFGLFGGLVFIINISSIIKSKLQHHKNTFFNNNFLPFLVLMLFLLTQGGINTELFFFLLALTTFVTYSSDKKSCYFLKNAFSSLGRNGQSKINLKKKLYE